MHDTLQLNRVGKKDADISRNFLGVFAADMIPWQEFNRRNNCHLIANTDPANMPGQHWVVMAKKNGKASFFDSYGMRPSEHNQSWRALDGRHASKLDLQQYESDVWGDYCLLFMKLLASQNSVDNGRFFSLFSEGEKKENDARVFEICHSIWPSILNVTQHDVDLDGVYDPPPNKCKQGCRSRKLS